MSGERALLARHARPGAARCRRAAVGEPREDQPRQRRSPASPTATPKVARPGDGENGELASVGDDGRRQLGGRLLRRRRPGGAGRRRPATAARCASRGPATRSPGRWRAATRAPSATSSTRPTSSCRSARSSCSAWSTGGGLRRVANLDLLVLLGFGVSHFFFNRAEIGVSVPLAVPGPALPPRPGALDRVARQGRGAAAGLAGGLAAGRGALPDRLPGRAQRRRLRRDRRRLRERRRRRPDRPRRTDLRQLPRRRLPGRHLRPGQLPRLRSLRGDLALVGELGRPARRPRRRGLLRPRHLRPADPARPAASARARRADELAATLAFGWAAYPYTAFALESNSNDTLVRAAAGRHAAAARPAGRARRDAGALRPGPSSLRRSSHAARRDARGRPTDADPSGARALAVRHSAFVAGLAARW